MKRAFRVAGLTIAVAVLAIMSGAPPAFAAGELDPTFSSDGKVFTDVFGQFYDSLLDAAAQPDGKIVAVGSWGSEDADGCRFAAVHCNFALVRYNPNGSVDSSFAANGRVLTSRSRWPAASGCTSASRPRRPPSGSDRTGRSCWQGRHRATWRPPGSPRPARTTSPSQVTGWSGPTSAARSTAQRWFCSGMGRSSSPDTGPGQVTTTTSCSPGTCHDVRGASSRRADSRRRRHQP